MDELTVQHGGGFTSGSYRKGTDSYGNKTIQMSDIRWIVTVNQCSVLSWSASEGHDRGWGQGRANNGHCTADVQCDWTFTTHNFNCR